LYVRGFESVFFCGQKAWNPLMLKGKQKQPLVLFLFRECLKNENKALCPAGFEMLSCLPTIRKNGVF
jgi:hypothetical protein